MSAKKVSITVESEVLDAVMKLVRARSTTLSEFTTTTLAREVRLERLGGALRDFEHEHGPIPAAERSRARTKIARSQRKSRRRAA